MDLTSPKIIKELLFQYDTRALKGLGQNFLINKNILQKIIETANLKATDIILEIGPGIGTLTKELAQRVKKVIAVEKDKKMCEILKETLSDFKNIKIINGDILKIENCKLKIENYKVVANLPYYIASPVIRKFLEAENPPESMVLTLQKEVAQRICAKPPDMSLLSVSVQFYAVPKIIFYVSKNYFWPSPKVDSAIIKITPLSFRRGPSSAVRGRASNQLFFKIVKAGFSQPRKQLAGNLAKNLLGEAKEKSFGRTGLPMLKDKKEVEIWLLKNNIKPNQRAETLSVKDWINLINSF